MSKAKLQVSHELQEQEPDIYAFFVRLAWDVEITVCPGEVTSSELCQVSACTLLNARCNRLKGSSFLSEQHDLQADRWVH